MGKIQVKKVDYEILEIDPWLKPYARDINLRMQQYNRVRAQILGDSEKDLSGAMLFLLNDDAAGFITGITIPVDGGFSAYSGV